ncbi:hypothetical protein Athai_08100 [Actinocatenispora thailandica]|uniref:Uncharacterized protein n=1 Tax=Actinocatenispora thailandica TaxID=227318 RepID=A0A7R7HUR6_9ACTN|nr:hypothetical protein [Actinocatenispora thailandica]BCJ33307.1 hypothetical protein Athai_08100 [Actinocatenispora thailandica]
MRTEPENRPGRVLVVGRSPQVLTDTVDLLRANGYSADATNRFGQVVDDYDVSALDVLVFGGMVPAETKEQLRATVRDRNPRVVFVQGLAGIPGLISAQVQAATTTEPPAIGAVGYDPDQRTVRFTLREPAHVTVAAWWLTSVVPPEPRSASMRVLDERRPAGSHTVALPERVPSTASFAALTVGSFARVFTVGPMPTAVTRLAPASATDNRLPPVREVTTRSDDQ